MAQVTETQSESARDRATQARSQPRAAPATPGKVALWLFLATEVMFFTGLIGSYIVLRAGSPSGSYSNLYPPATPLARLGDKKGVVLVSAGADPATVAPIVARAAGLNEDAARALVEGTHHARQVVQANLTESAATALQTQLQQAGAVAVVEGLVSYSWPAPYQHELNPLSIDLTAINTFILICSSVTMVLALSAIQRGDKRKLSLYLLATVVIGSVFLGIQVIEYNKLIRVDYQSIGVAKTHHFLPGSSLFASCFFTMTGFHGAHVLGGIVTLTLILIQSLRGVYTASHHAAVELAGLYWHFVDLVWILLFTVVYLI